MKHVARGVLSLGAVLALALPGSPSAASVGGAGSVVQGLGYISPGFGTETLLTQPVQHYGMNTKEAGPVVSGPGVAVSGTEVTVSGPGVAVLMDCTIQLDSYSGGELAAGGEGSGTKECSTMENALGQATKHCFVSYRRTGLHMHFLESCEQRVTTRVGGVVRDAVTGTSGVSELDLRPTDVNPFVNYVVVGTTAAVVSTIN